MYAATEDPNRFLPLLLVLLLAFVVPIALARFRRIPVVVGEIMAGILIGPSILGWVGDAPILTFMSDIGLAFLMFLAGMEIELTTLFPTRARRAASKGPQLLPVVLRIYVLTLALAIGAGFMLHRLDSAGDPWLLAFVLSATSLGVVLPILKERGQLGSRLGQMVFLSATLADFVTVVLLTIYIITLDRGFDLEILSLGLLFLAFLIFYRLGPGLVRIPRVRDFFEDLSQATVQLKVRGAIAILMSFVVLAEFVDAELILGAFLAGMIISLLKSQEDEPLVHKLEAFGFGFFIPVFFVMVGVELNLGTVLESPEALLGLPLIMAAAIIVKIMPLITIKRWFSWRELVAGGALLNTHLSLEIAVAVIGLRTGLFDPATSTTVILFAVLTVVAMPLLFGSLLPHRPEQMQRHMLIVGINDLSIKVAQELRAHGDDVRFLKQGAAPTQLAVDAGFQLVEGLAGEEGLAGINLELVKTVLALSEDEAVNLAVSRQAKAMGQRNVVAWVEDPDHLPEFQRLKVQPFSSAIQRITLLALMARNPNTYTLLTSATDDRDIGEMRLGNPLLTGIMLRNLRLPGDFLVLAIRRDGELVIPRGNTVLQLGDRLTVVGNPRGLAEIAGWVEGLTDKPLGLSTALH